VKRFLNLTLEMIDHKKLWRIVKRFLNLTLEMIDHRIQWRKGRKFLDLAVAQWRTGHKIQ